MLHTQNFCHSEPSLIPLTLFSATEIARQQHNMGSDAGFVHVMSTRLRPCCISEVGAVPNAAASLIAHRYALSQSKTLKTPLMDGWGLCTDGKSLILSNSTAALSWLDPNSLALQRTVTVHDGNVSVPWINEVCHTS
jgi:hypothetical protein